MARKKMNFNIEGKDIEVFQLPVPVSLKVLTRLTKILARPIGAAVGGSSDSGSFLDKSIDLGDIIGSLGDKLDEDIVISTIEMTLPYLTVNQRPVNNLESFDDYGPIFLLKVMAKVLEVNFGDFFAEFLEKGNSRIAESRKEILSPH